MWPSGDWSYPDPLSQPGAAPDAAPFHVCRFNEAWLAVIVGSLERLKVAEFWEGDTAAVAETLQQIDECLNQLATEYTPPTMTIPIGAIMAYGGSWDAGTPADWLECNGASLSVSEYPDLYAVLGGTYGITGSPATHFNLPDMTGRVIEGTASGLSLGDKTGQNTVTLQTANLPAHSHNLDASDGTDLYTYSGSGGGRYGLTKGSGLSTVSNRLTTENTGSGTPVSVKQPTITCRYIIKAK